jgi:hypothetical protein
MQRLGAVERAVPRGNGAWAPLELLLSFAAAAAEAYSATCGEEILALPEELGRTLRCIWYLPIYNHH